MFEAPYNPNRYVNCGFVRGLKIADDSLYDALWDRKVHFGLHVEISFLVFVQSVQELLSITVLWKSRDGDLCRLMGALNSISGPITGGYMARHSKARFQMNYIQGT